MKTLIRKLKTVKRIGVTGLLHLLCERLKSDREWEKLLEKNEITTVLDVGANDGQTYSELRRIGFKGDILSFEPYKPAFDNLEKKSGYKWLKYNVAVSSQNGEASLFSTGCHQGSSINLPILNPVSQHTVSCIRLDGLKLAKTEKVFLKVDTQGHDLEVVHGTRGILHQVNLIMVEAMFRSGYNNSPSVLEFIQQLNTFGYELVKTRPGMADKSTGVDSHVDLIFQRKCAT